MTSPAEAAGPPAQSVDGERALPSESAVTGPEEATRPPPSLRHRGAERVRSFILKPRGGGTRRRASDAVRLGLAVLLVAISVPLARANTSAEVHLTQLLTPPPAGSRWLVATLWQLGSFGVIVALALVGLLVPRLAAIRQMAIAGLGALGLCLLLVAVLGTGGGRPPIPELSGIDAHYPVTQLALAMAVALTGLPFLSRPMHRMVGTALVLAALSAIIGGYGLPVNVAAAIALGWGTAAACHLVLGSPVGLLSAEEVTEAVRDLRVDVRALAPMAAQVWGVEAFAGQDDQGRRLELTVYGRDAANAQWLSKVWRFCMYRDSGPALVINRLQQVEHEAYLTLMTAKVGVRVPEVVAAGLCGPRGDAALVTRLPAGPRLAEMRGDQVADEVVAEFLRAALALRAAGIAHGALSPETVVVARDGPYLRDFQRASSSAPAARTDRDLAAAVAAAGVVVGVDRVTAAARRVLDADTVRSVLTQLQRSTLDPATERMARSRKGFLRSLRESLAAAMGVEVPKLAEAKRISWMSLVMVVGSLIGLWAILGVLTDVSGALDVIRGADWGWVALAFVLAQLTVVTNAWALTGAVAGSIPFGRCVALETSNDFTAFVGGDAAVFGIRVRFFQRQGFDASVAISSGAIASTASWVAKGLLFLLSLRFAAGDFHVPTGESGDQETAWIIVIVIFLAGVVAAVVALVPRIRRLASQKVRPHLVSIWANVKTIATEPRKIVYVVAGATGTQLLVALSLGCALRAVGQRETLATILVVMTLSSIIGSAVPIPGGAGIVEAGMIAGLTSAGVPESEAVAAVFIQRLCTAYLPPIWGWATLVWMRHREYI